MEHPMIAGFYDDETYPKFEWLPRELDISPHTDYFHRPEGSENWVPKRHWCLVAEIVEIENFLRFGVIAKDRVGHKFGIYFYSPDGGAQFQSSARVGRTIAILNPHLRQFLDGREGIRVEDSSVVKILPYSWSELLALDKRIVNTIKDVSPCCHACGKQPDEGLQKCSRCGLFFYCNKECQKDGWDNKNHKLDCKMLKDNDLRKMYTLDWETYNGPLSFPL